MKRMILISTAVLLGLNLIVKLILSHYAWFNLGLSSLVLCNNALLLYALSTPKIADGFRVAGSFIYSFIGGLLFVISMFSKQTIVDNWLVLVVIVAFGLQWLVYVLLRVVSKVTAEHGGR